MHVTLVESLTQTLIWITCNDLWSSRSTSDAFLSEEASIWCFFGASLEYYCVWFTCRYRCSCFKLCLGLWWTLSFYTIEIDSEFKANTSSLVYINVVQWSVLCSCRRFCLEHLNFWMSCCSCCSEIFLCGIPFFFCVNFLLVLQHDELFHSSFVRLACERFNAGYWCHRQFNDFVVACLQKLVTAYLERVCVCSVCPNLCLLELSFLSTFYDTA